MYYAATTQKDVVHELVRRGADINFKSRNGISIDINTFLLSFCRRHTAYRLHVDTVEVLCELGANPNLTNKDGDTALHIVLKERIDYFSNSKCKTKEELFRSPFTLQFF